jgi:hypothetical protein
MTIPTALAPTAKLATPRVKKFVEGLLELFGPSAKLDALFLCEPSVNEVFGVNEQWLEANWGADIITDRFSLADLEEMRHESKTIHIGDTSVSPCTNSKLQVRLWLFARVMRY